MIKKTSKMRKMIRMTISVGTTISTALSPPNFFCFSRTASSSFLVFSPTVVLSASFINATTTCCCSVSLDILPHTNPVRTKTNGLFFSHSLRMRLLTYEWIEQTHIIFYINGFSLSPSLTWSCNERRNGNISLAGSVIVHTLDSPVLSVIFSFFSFAKASISNLIASSSKNVVNLCASHTRFWLDRENWKSFSLERNIAADIAGRFWSIGSRHGAVNNSLISLRRCHP